MKKETRSHKDELREALGIKTKSRSLIEDIVIEAALIYYGGNVRNRVVGQEDLITRDQMIIVDRLIEGKTLAEAGDLNDISGARARTVCDRALFRAERYLASSGIMEILNMDYTRNVFNPKHSLKEKPKWKRWWLERKNVIGGYWEAYEEQCPGSIEVVSVGALSEVILKNNQLENKVKELSEFADKALKGGLQYQQENQKLRQILLKARKQIAVFRDDVDVLEDIDKALR